MLALGDPTDVQTVPARHALGLVVHHPPWAIPHRTPVKPWIRPAFCEQQAVRVVVGSKIARQGSLMYTTAELSRRRLALFGLAKSIMELELPEIT